MPKYTEPRERSSKGPKHQSIIAIKRSIATLEAKKLTASPSERMEMAATIDYLKSKLAERPGRD